MPHRKTGFFVLVLTCLLVSVSAARPELKIAPAGFPTSQNTPEGAASDLARAFMTQNARWFRLVCVRTYGDGAARAEYTDYLEGVTKHLKQGDSSPSPDEPKKISKVFAARHLSKSGPSSYGYAAFGFADVMFVDVEVALRSGKTNSRRTMVIKDRDGKWYAHPVPDVSPLLSDGLYDETPSTRLAH